MPRRVKDSGFSYLDSDTGKEIAYYWRNRLKRLLCWIIGHDEVGVYSWISYCQRCTLAFEPSEEGEEEENDEEE